MTVTGRQPTASAATTSTAATAGAAPLPLLRFMRQPPDLGGPTGHR
ncbi:hypothetical protein PQR15_13100 [Streptomyces lydicus]|nr:hypothetical protein [Streptomyces lydicus]